MTLHLSPDRIWLANAAGTPIFDTAAGMFRALRFASGFQDIPARTATSTPTVVTPVNIDVTYGLATIPTACTTVLGMIQLVRSGASFADPAGKWQAVNGSKLDINWMCGPLSSTQSETTLSYDCGLGFLTFLAGGGALTMREELTLRAPQGPSATWTSTRPATRVHYRLFCGAFI